MAKQTERELNDTLAAIASEYEDEERAAAEEEAREAAGSAVFSVRLPAAVYAAVREVAKREHLTPSALIRQWVSERVSADDGPDDLNDAVASLRRDVERVAKLARSA